MFFFNNVVSHYLECALVLESIFGFNQSLAKLVYYFIEDPKLRQFGIRALIRRSPGEQLSLLDSIIISPSQAMHHHPSTHKPTTHELNCRIRNLKSWSIFIVPKTPPTRIFSETIFHRFPMKPQHKKT